MAVGSRLGSCVAAATGLLAALVTPLHAAQGDRVGGQFQVNEITTLTQSSPSVAPDGAGGFVVVWQSIGPDGDAFSVQARRYAPAGTPLAGEFQVNTYTTSSQRDPEVAALAGGGFVVVWGSSGSSGTDSSLASIQGQVFDAAGAPVGIEFQVNTFTTGLQYGASVTADGPGFVVIWNSDGSPGTDASDVSVQARRYDGTGAPAGAQFQVNTFTTGAQTYAAVGPDGSGGFVVVWSSEGSAGTDADLTSVHGQRFDANGPVGAEFQVNTFTTSEQTYPVVTEMGAGGFVVLWMSAGSLGTDTSGLSIQMQRYDAGGVPAGGQFQVNTFTTTTQDHPKVGPDGTGGFVAMWESAGSMGTDQSGFSAQARLFDDAGQPVTGEFQVNTYTTLDQESYGACPDGGGGFVIIWDSLGSATDNQGRSIQAQRFAGPDPTTTTSTTLPGATTSTSTTSTTFLGASTTSTTTTESSTTSSTAPFGAEALTGRSLQLRTRPGRPDKSALVLVSKDSSVTLGRGNQSPDDPVASGGTLGLSSAAGGFAARHDLAGAWAYLGKAGQNKGYKWKSAGSPIQSVIIKRGKLVKVVGRGAALGFDLDDDPNPVRLELAIGGRLFCFAYGGDTVAFKGGKRYVARRAGAPGACP